MCLTDKLLEPLEPGNLSAPSLRRMMVRGQHEQNKASLQRIIELGTGRLPDLMLSGMLGQQAYLQQYARDRYATRGRRCQAAAGAGAGRVVSHH